jgi:6-pyruvoyltetrahydropterin/6-carboxytetrahydropterin synthase
VIQAFDHRFLNYEAPPFDRVIPTTENIAIEIWRRIEPHLAGSRGKLRNVRLYETPDLHVDYDGGE